MKEEQPDPVLERKLTIEEIFRKKRDLRKELKSSLTPQSEIGIQRK